MTQSLYPHPERGEFLLALDQSTSNEQSCIGVLFIDLMEALKASETIPHYENTVAHAIRQIFNLLDRSPKPPSSMTFCVTLCMCWREWLSEDIPNQATPWFACVLNLLNAYGADFNEIMSDPTGNPSNFRRLFTEDEVLGPYMQLDGIAFKHGILHAATPKALGHSRRRTL